MEVLKDIGALDPPRYLDSTICANGCFKSGVVKMSFILKNTENTNLKVWYLRKSFLGLIDGDVEKWARWFPLLLFAKVRETKILKILPFLS